MLSNSRILLGLLLAPLALLNGCATLTGSPEQQVMVETKTSSGKPITGVKCKVSNERGTWFVTTPGSVKVHKSAGNLRVISQKPSPFGVISIPSKANAGMIANAILPGGFIGAAIDHKKGTAYDYPSHATLVLEESGAAKKSN